MHIIPESVKRTVQQLCRPASVFVSSSDDASLDLDPASPGSLGDNIVDMVDNKEVTVVFLWFFSLHSFM